MDSYNKTRQKYLPGQIKILLIAESPPPAANVESSRHFYRTDKTRKDDRLFINTVRAIYPESTKASEHELEQEKDKWLRRLQADGWFVIEALETSLPHEVTKQERQDKIRKNLPRLLSRVRNLANKDTRIILIKSNVFEVAAEPLRQSGFTVLNNSLLDYPGRYNQHAYREKLSKLAKAV